MDLSFRMQINEKRILLDSTHSCSPAASCCSATHAAIPTVTPAITPRVPKFIRSYIQIVLLGTITYEPHQRSIEEMNEHAKTDCADCVEIRECKRSGKFNRTFTASMLYMTGVASSPERCRNGPARTPIEVTKDGEELPT